MICKYITDKLEIFSHLNLILLYLATLNTLMSLIIVLYR